jgi:CRISPR-associated endonuclease Csn1
MKKILGLDLGTTSIGFAYVVEHENSGNSEIKQIGVRVNPLTTDEQTNFEKGKPISINADRTLKRGARRNLDRYQNRRSNLIHALLKGNIISKETKLAEFGKNTTHLTWKLRAKSVKERIEKEDLARVFLAINKKRGYKSSRKAKNEDVGQAIDGMEVAKKLYEENLTPGQLAYSILKGGKKHIPDFYRSDLQAELDKVWNFQRQFYPEIFTDQFKKELKGKGQRATATNFWVKHKFNTAEIKGTREEKKIQEYKWRNDAIFQRLEKEEVAFVITEINNNLNNSSGYLGAISDRSKELYFNKETVGQFLYKQLLKNPHTRMKNQVFYRQDYLDEFEVIWNEQKKYHIELTDELKAEIRDIVIFYQRKLKSQKGLISFCEFESREIELVEGKKKIIGLKVTPKSSPIFQEFKIWQILQNLLIKKKGSKKRVMKNEKQVSLFEEEREIFVFDLEAKKNLFDELNLKGNLSAKSVLEILGYKNQEWELNYSQLEGNRTNKAFYEAYLKIIEIEGYDVKDLLKVKSNKDEVNLEDINIAASEIKMMVKQIFETLKINTEILDFNPELEGKEFEMQPFYQLWHLLYSYEGDDSPSGNERLYNLLEKKFGFQAEHCKILADLTLVDDYGDLSTKAIRKIFPYIKENNYSTACDLAGYRHSASSLTKDEIASRPLKNKLELLKKNSLRNPVVEKILNQMVNVINALIEKNSKRDENGNIVEFFKFEEIRIELSRELKKNAKERAEMTTNINAAKTAHEKIFKLLQNEFGVKNPSRNDIIRYRLYEELKNNGYKDLYTNTYIPREILFSKQIDIDHIIPQAKLFDDSFSNKTVVFRKDNLDKGNKTAFDYIESKYGEKNLTEYENRIESIFELGKKNKEEGISKAKYLKLIKKESEIGEGFIERDLRDSQYIAKKAKNMLYEISKSVITTTGSITDRLREDWGLINIMQELNFDKFKKLGLTEIVEKKDGTFKEKIIDWSKRNDHRHHAMDALTIAFTKHSHIQYLNNLNARKNEKNKFHRSIIGIENNETHVMVDDQGNKKRVFNLPIPNFRHIAKEHLENVLVSHKAKNKVVTKNKNITKSETGEKVKIELTPRGQLHKETVYGKYRYYESKVEKVSINFDLETILKVANPKFKKLLLERFSENGNDPQKAFSGKNALSKKPIYLNSAKTEVLPEKIKLVWLEENYSIRKDITPENFKDEKSIEKIIDTRAKIVLLDRLKEFGSDPKKAFTDLDKNPIWLNESKEISIKRVTISGVKNANSLHFKKDNLGNEILDKEGNKIPTDFVSTGNNHHVAIYRDEKGGLQEKVVSFFEALERINQGLDVIDKSFNTHLGWQFQFTLKQNEYFVFPNDKLDFNPIELDLLKPENAKLISPNLFRVQKFTIRDYFFRHHLETNVEDNSKLKGITWKREGLIGINNIVKVRLNHLGAIIKVGEY